MKRSEEAYWFFGSLYFILLLGTIPFIRGWAWWWMFIVMWWAWLAVPWLIEKQEKEEAKSKCR